MREIKFRAWEQGLNIMILWEDFKESYTFPNEGDKEIIGNIYENGDLLK